MLNNSGNIGILLNNTDIYQCKTGNIDIILINYWIILAEYQ